MSIHIIQQSVVPFYMVVCAIGTVKNGKVDNIKKAMGRATVTEIKKICVLVSTRILGKVLMTDATAAWFAPG